MSRVFYVFGNGKRDPAPRGLRKIKRIGFKTFLDLGELFEDFKCKVAKAQSRVKKLRPRAPQEQQS